MPSTSLFPVLVSDLLAACDGYEEFLRAKRKRLRNEALADARLTKSWLDRWAYGDRIPNKVAVKRIYSRVSYPWIMCDMHLRRGPQIKLRMAARAVKGDLCYLNETDAEFVAAYKQRKGELNG